MIKHIRKNVVFTVSGILFLVYFVIVSIHWGRVDGFNNGMIFIGLVWILVSIKIKKVSGALKKLPWVIKVFLKFSIIVFALSFIVIESVIICNMRTTATLDADYVIVLGCRVNGSIPSLPLTRRINAAVRYLNENRNAKVVVSGGKGTGEDISEAEAMKRMLILNGIDHGRIFEESESTSTVENLEFSNKLYSLQDKDVVIVSSDYHLFRALSMARKLNYKNVSGLPGKSQFSVLPVYLLREYATVAYYILSNRIW